MGIQRTMRVVMVMVAVVVHVFVFVMVVVIFIFVVVMFVFIFVVIMIIVAMLVFRLSEAKTDVCEAARFTADRPLTLNLALCQAELDDPPAYPVRQVEHFANNDE